MEKPTDLQLAAAAEIWRLTKPPQFLRRVANFVYETEIDGRPVILRLTEVKRRSKSEISAELEWMDFLSQNGMGVAAPVATPKEGFVAELPGPPQFLAAVFERARGKPLKDKSDFSEPMLFEWGRFIGRMHSLTSQYAPAGDIPRQQWFNDDTLATALRSHEPSDGLPYECMNGFLEWMRGLPQDRNAYGLIHGDLHHGNFFVENLQITAFDFDDSCYHWFSYDLTPALFSIMNFSDDNGFGFEYGDVAEPYLRGYLREFQLAPLWMDRVPLFLKFRSVLVYYWAKTSLIENVFDERGIQWAKKRMASCLEDIKNPVHFF